LLKERAQTQDAASKAMGIPVNTFRSWMSKGRVPPLSDVYTLAQFLGVSIDYLINGQRDKAAKTNAKVIDLLKRASGKLESI